MLFMVVGLLSSKKLKKIDITRYLALNTLIYFAMIINQRIHNTNAMTGYTISVSSKTENKTMSVPCTHRVALNSKNTNKPGKD